MASVDFVQGALLKLLVNSDSCFGLKQVQKIAVKCLLEGRDVFAMMPTGFSKSFSVISFFLFLFLIVSNKIDRFLKNKQV